MIHKMKTGGQDDVSLEEFIWASRNSGILIEMKRLSSHDEINWAETAMSKLHVE